MNIDISNAHCGPRIQFPDHAWLRVVSVPRNCLRACRRDACVRATFDVSLGCERETLLAECGPFVRPPRNRSRPPGRRLKSPGESACKLARARVFKKKKTALRGNSERVRDKRMTTFATDNCGMVDAVRLSYAPDIHAYTGRENKSLIRSSFPCITS